MPDSLFLEALGHFELQFNHTLDVGRGLLDFWDIRRAMGSKSIYRWIRYHRAMKEKHAMLAALLGIAVLLVFTGLVLRLM